MRAHILSPFVTGPWCAMRSKANMTRADVALRAEDAELTTTLFEKIWERNAILEREDGATLLYVDRHLVHDGSRQAFDMLEAHALSLRRPDLTLGTADHYVATGSSANKSSPEHKDMAARLAANATRWGFDSYGAGAERQGIVHVIGPELGFTLPGAVLVCGDSHTSTHGALGALSFGIGTSEVAHVLATQALWQRKPRQMRIVVSGRLGAGVAAKDLVLALIGKIGAAGGTGYAIEYAGPAIEALSIEERMTVCNMSIEAGARLGMIAPDEKTIAWLKGRPMVPTGAEWERAAAEWRALKTEEGAMFHQELTFDAHSVAPTVTWGTSPEDALPVTGRVPDPASISDPHKRRVVESKLAYMGLRPGMLIEEIAVDRVFIGSCTNSRIEDLRAAAQIARRHKAKVPAYVTPGSGQVKAQAEAEGLDRIFVAAGFEWTDPGCSMCVAMNGDIVPAGARCASTSNRNFAGRQGRGSRTHLLSPAMAAAAAITGKITDSRQF